MSEEKFGCSDVHKDGAVGKVGYGADRVMVCVLGLEGDEVQAIDESAPWLAYA